MACSTVTIVDGDDGQSLGGGGAHEGGAPQGGGGASLGPIVCDPNAVETCNGADDNCDGRVDEDFPRSWAIPPKVIADVPDATFDASLNLSVFLDATPTGYRAFATVPLEPFNFGCPSGTCQFQLVTWELNPDGDVVGELSVLMPDVDGVPDLVRQPDGRWAIVACERTLASEGRLQFATLDQDGEFTRGDRIADYACEGADLYFDWQQITPTGGHVLYAWYDDERTRIADFSPDGALLGEHSLEREADGQYLNLVASGDRTFLMAGSVNVDGLRHAQIVELHPDGSEKGSYEVLVEYGMMGIISLVADAHGAMKLVTEVRVYDVTDPEAPIDQGPIDQGWRARTFRPRADVGWHSVDSEKLIAYSADGAPEWTQEHEIWHLPYASAVDRGSRTAIAWISPDGLQFGAVGCE